MTKTDVQRQEPADDAPISLPVVAQILGVSRPTAAFYAAQKRFPVTEVGGRVFARRSDVERYRDDRAGALRALKGQHA